MNKKLLINGKCLIDNQIVHEHRILFDRKIEAVLFGSETSDAEIIDANGAYVFPGFVDIHLHGLCGVDVMDASSEALATICSSLPAFGVTGFLATTMTMDQKAISKALHAVKAAMIAPPVGTKILGAHLEGPFISPKYAGAQDARYIQTPDWKPIKSHLDIIKLITLAVEEDLNFSFIRNNPGIKLSIGHSDASFESALAAYDLGVTHCTHCMNAMSPFHHRRPGVVGACFTKKYETEIIADTVHIHPGFLETLARIIGPEQLILISDSMRACGMPDGEYSFGGQKVLVSDRIPYLADGTLAGSTLTMDTAVRNMHRHTSLSLPQIIRMATSNPAQSIGISSLGKIKPGCDADFVIMDERLNVLKTIINGETLYSDSKNLS